MLTKKVQFLRGLLDHPMISLVIDQAFDGKRLYLVYQLSKGIKQFLIQSLDNSLSLSNYLEMCKTEGKARITEKRVLDIFA